MNICLLYVAWWSSSNQLKALGEQTSKEEYCLNLELCGFSWGKVNKCLFVLDRALTTDQNKDSTEVQLGEPMSLSELLTGG